MILVGDCIESMRGLPDESAQTCVTSPPYFGLRDYGHAGQIGLESTPDAFVAKLVEVFREVRRVLRGDGTLWLNLGDSYASGIKGSGGIGKSTMAGTACDGNGQKFDARKIACDVPDKNLLGIPWRVAFSLQADGWYLRQDIIWSKPNPMPESVRDRCTKAHEYLFLLSKGPRYYYDADAIAEPVAPGNEGATLGLYGRRAGAMARDASGNEARHIHDQPLRPDTRNKRSVWTVATMPFKEAHFATFPEALIEPCILAATRSGDTVLDPFGGAGTTGVVAQRLGREHILCELNPDYAAMAERRIRNTQPGLALGVAA